MYRKRKKVVKYRGSRTHGAGEKKRRRGKGNRGGVGKAGTGKRADQKKPSIQKLKNYFGRRGFHSLKPKKKAINLSYIEKHLDKLITQGLVIKKDGFFVIDGSVLGYDKLLGSGKVKNKYLIQNIEITETLKQKVVNAGGKIDGNVATQISKHNEENISEYVEN